MFGAHVIDKRFGPPNSTPLNVLSPGKSNFESNKCCKELGAAELSDLFCYCHICWRVPFRCIISLPD